MPALLRGESRVASVLAWLDRWWFALCGLALIVGSDYKWRTRPPGEALGGGLDATIAWELMLYGAVAAYLVLYRVRLPHRVSRVPAPVFLAVCFVALVVLSVPFSPFPQYSMVRAFQMCILLLLTIVAAADCDRAHFHRFAHGFVVLVAASVIYGVVVPSTPINSIQVGRFTWLAIHPTVSGVLTSLATVLVVSYLILGRRSRPGPHWPVPVYLLLLLLVGGGMLAAQTRGAIAGAAAALLVVTIATRGRRGLVGFAAGLVVVALGVALVAGNQVTEYFERGSDSTDLATLNNRTELWEFATRAIAEQPLFGHGVSASRGIFLAEIGLGGGHNAAINVIVELGFVGFAVWLAIVLSLLVGLRRLPRHSGSGLELDRAMLLGVVVFLMVDGVFFEGPGAVANVASTWFFVTIAWYVAARRESAEQDAISEAEGQRAALAASGGIG